MENNDVMSKIAEIIVIIGAIVGIIAFFLAWQNTDVGTFTGLDLTNNKSIFYEGQEFHVRDIITSWHAWIPLISLILVVLAAIAAVASFFVEIPKMYFYIGCVVIGLVVLILAILFFTGECDVVKFGAKVAHVKLSDHAGVGIWVSLVGGVIIALAGALGLAGVFDKLTGGSSNAQ